MAHQMAIVREFDNGVILYGRREVQPEKWSDTSEETEDDSFRFLVTPVDMESNRLDEEEPQLSKEVEFRAVPEERPKEELQLEKLEKPEDQHHQHQPSMLLELISCDSGDEGEAKGNSSRESQDSESYPNQSSDHGPSELFAAVVVSPPTPAPQLSSWSVLPPGSKAKGVSYHKNNKQWEAHLWIQGRQLRNRRKKGVQIFMGNYSTEDEAKQAHDRAAIKFEVRTSGRISKPYPLNFHESEQADFIAEHRDWSLRDFLWKLRRYSLKFSSGKSNMKGVTVRVNIRKHSSTLRYEAKIARSDGRKTTCTIGTFASEEEAGKAYDRALLFLNKDKEEVELWHVITNFRPSTYTAEEILEAGEKLVFI